MKKVIAITGPTASGKTALSIKLAKLFDLEVISIDSVQVYKHLNIGSAKITEEEMCNVKHHLISELDLNSQVTVSWFQERARCLINSSHKPFLLVGGTGLYLNAILYDFRFTSPSRNVDFGRKYASYTNDELYDLLKTTAKFDISSIHKNNRKRVLRKLEIALSNNLEDDPVTRPLYDFKNYYLDIDRNVLRARVNYRIEKMFKDGLEAENKALYDKQYNINAIGYKEFIPYFKGLEDLKSVRENIFYNTLQLAKKQKTWFKNKLPSIFINPLEPDFVSQIAKDIHKFIYNDRIILSGLPLSGKSTLGLKLANKLNYEFIDLDLVIEKKYGSISDLFNLGEDYFRKIEHECLVSLQDKTKVVIALGGGTLTYKSNIPFLNGFNIFLNVNPLDLNSRHSNTIRPLLNNFTLEELYNKRIGTYLKYANLVIENADLDLTIEKIIKYLTYEDISENLSYKWS